MKEERLYKDLQTKLVYNFIDTDQDIDQISREVYKKKDVVTHYPRGFEGGDKYDTIKKFTIKGFRGKPPVGIIKSPHYGYGFTRPLNPFARYVDHILKTKEVIIERAGPVKIDQTKKTLHLNERALQRLHTAFKAVYTKNRAEIDDTLARTSHELFPDVIERPTPRYIPDALSHALSSWGNSIEEFSEDDKAAIRSLFEKLSSSTDFLTRDALQQTKQIVDVRYIDSALNEFDRLFQKTSNTTSLEKKWQVYLRSYSWIFSSIFAQPVILHQDEAYAGGKSIDNRGGEFTDFLIKNGLTDNVALFEIKTHKTNLLESKPYRGDSVFGASRELSGCVNQVLSQRDTLQKTYANLMLSSNENFESVNSSCVVLVGSIEALTKKQYRSFELFRSNSKDVDVLTFDEIRKKIALLRSVLSGEE